MFWILLFVIIWIWLEKKVSDHFWEKKVDGGYFLVKSYVILKFCSTKFYFTLAPSVDYTVICRNISSIHPSTGQNIQCTIFLISKRVFKSSCILHLQDLKLCSLRHANFIQNDMKMVPKSVGSKSGISVTSFLDSQ